MNKKIYLSDIPKEIIKFSYWIFDNFNISFSLISENYWKINHDKLTGSLIKKDNCWNIHIDYKSLYDKDWKCPIICDVLTTNNKTLHKGLTYLLTAEGYLDAEYFNFYFWKQLSLYNYE